VIVRTLSLLRLLGSASDEVARERAGGRVAAAKPAADVPDPQRAAAIHQQARIWNWLEARGYGESP
jgi:hypothetical protein